MMGLIEKKLRTRLRGHQNQIYSMDISPDDQYLATGGMDMTCRVWNTITNECVTVLRNHTDTINGVNFAANGEMLVTGSMDADVIVYKTEGWQVHRHVRSNGWRTVYSAVFNNACTKVLFGADAIIRIYDLESEREVGILEGHTKQVRCITLTKNDKIACSGGHDRCIRVWDLERLCSIGKLDGH